MVCCDRENYSLSCSQGSGFEPPRALVRGVGAVDGISRWGLWSAGGGQPLEPTPAERSCAQALSASRSHRFDYFGGFRLWSFLFSEPLGLTLNLTLNLKVKLYKPDFYRSEVLEERSAWESSSRWFNFAFFFLPPARDTFQILQDANCHLHLDCHAHSLTGTLTKSRPRAFVGFFTSVPLCWRPKSPRPASTSGPGSCRWGAAPPSWLGPPGGGCPGWRTSKCPSGSFVFTRNTKEEEEE